jgi:Ser/Thr protein kinase RdoA (MazF antagonist)
MESAEAAAMLAPHAREALDAFGVRPARIALVSCSENVTFRVETASPEETFALRLHRSGYNTLGELLSERMWTRALREAGIQTPEDMTAPDGASFVAVGSGDETARLAGLTRWIHGDLLATRIERAAGPGDTLEALRGLGALTARLHDQTRAWRPPEGFSRRSLEVETLLAPTSTWGCFWRHPRLSRADQRHLAAAARTLVRRISACERTIDTFGLIHADLHPGNVIVQDEGPTVIDFDDAGFGWRLYDIAAALFHSHAPEAEIAFLDGYGGAGAIRLDTGLLPLFRLMRALALIGWLAHRPELDAAERFNALRVRALGLAEMCLSRF